MLIDTLIILIVMAIMLIVLIVIGMLVERVRENKVRKEYKRRLEYIRSFKDYK